MVAVLRVISVNIHYRVCAREFREKTRGKLLLDLTVCCDSAVAAAAAVYKKRVGVFSGRAPRDFAVRRTTETEKNKIIMHATRDNYYYTAAGAPVIYVRVQCYKVLQPAN